MKRYSLRTSFFCLLGLILFVSGCATPESFYAFDGESNYLWATSLAHWQESANVCAQHTQGLSGLGVSAFAQSFVPRCAVIRAVQLNLYPVKASGWLRAELAKDENGLPGRVLSRSWLRIETHCPVPLRGYMTFPFTDVYVEPYNTYWITIVEFPDAEYLDYSITNLAFHEVSDVPEEELLLRSRYSLLGYRVANFKIISSYDGLPGIHAVSEKEKRSLPPRICRNASWLNAKRMYDKAMKGAEVDENRGGRLQKSQKVVNEPIGNEIFPVTEKAPAKMRQVTGEIVAIDATAMTFTIRGKRGEATIAAGDDTIVRIGKDKKSLADIKSGDKLSVRYVEIEGKKLAKNIIIPSYVRLGRSAAANDLPSSIQSYDKELKEVTIVELKPSGGAFMAQIEREARKAKQMGLKPFVYFHANWCTPCNALVNSLNNRGMSEAFEGTYIILLNVEDWNNKKAPNRAYFFNESGFMVFMLPMFIAIDDSGKPTGKKLGGDAWGENVPENMAPVLKSFFRNTGSAE